MLTLENYNNFQELVVVILSLELIILIMLLLSLIFRRIFASIIKKRERNIIQLIDQEIFNSFEQLPFNPRIPIFKSTPPKSLFRILENFNRRYNIPNWIKIRNAISTLYLLPIARKKAYSYFWTNRNFSARCFNICPRQEDTKIILKLLDDPVFLVNSIAAIAAIKLEIKEGITKIVELMSRDTTQSQCLYRDIILQNSSDPIFLWIIELADNTKDLHIHLACLDLLSNKSIVIDHPFLRQDLESEHPHVRLAALKVFARNPQSDSQQILLSHLTDKDDDMRKQAASGLQLFPSSQVIEQLNITLSDPLWDVRFAAALSLKNMGIDGIEVLLKQTESTPLAFEAAQYAFQFDW